MPKKMCFASLLMLLLFDVCIVHAQQDAQYTQYMYNTNAINPAYTGSREIFSAFLLHRNQWLGIDGAPVTNNATVTTKIGESNFGAGLSFTNDQIGPSTENTISADLAYFVSLNESYKLSFGLRTTANLYALNNADLNLLNSNDPEFQNFNNEISPNLGGGLYLYSNKTYFGISVPNLFETKRFNPNEVQIITERMHYYFITGTVFELNTNIDFKPTLLIKAVEGAPLQTDLSANFLFHKKLTLGIAYRLETAASILAGFQLHKNWFIGYAYDRETTNLANYNNGSHELFLRYEFSKTSRISSPRFF